jgi:glutaredoxin
VDLIEINNTTYIPKSTENQEKYAVPEVIELNDSNIDSTIKDGIYNRWLILCYLETCYHCKRARQVLNDILESGNYPVINNIKFAQIEVHKNIKSNIRFNISKVPHIILVENNTMYELELYPSEKNLLNFIGTDFRNVTKDIMPFPHMNIFKYYYAIFDNSVSEIVKKINDFLKTKNIFFEFNSFTFILSYVVLCSAISIIFIFSIMKCFTPKKNKNKIKKLQIKNENDREKVKKKENKGEKNNIESEEIKKIREEEKEKEMKDTIIKKGEKENNNKENKKEKKKKKE